LLGIQLWGFAQKPQNFTVAQNPSLVGFSAERLKRIDQLEEEFIKNGIAPNAVTFVARKGKIVHSKAFGFKNINEKIALKKNDIFRILKLMEIKHSEIEGRYKR
jgi:CubicO group peptidase (beta-lactamase class C family)